MSSANPLPQVPEGAETALETLIPANMRKYVYAVFALLGLVIACIVLAFMIADADNVPKWTLIVTAIWNFLSAPFGVLAAKNVNKVTA